MLHETPGPTRSLETSLTRLPPGLPLGLALLPALLLAPDIIEKIPLSHDHATHLFKAWHFATELLPSGRLRGFSHYWGFGFPSDELVPCGGEVWVGAFRVLTLGLLSWTRTYAVAFAGLMVLKSYAAFRFGRHFFDARVGVIAAWLTLFDPGAMLEGGWVWHTEWGVWPVTLAASVFTLALVRLDDVLTSGRTRDVVIAGLFVGAALLCHQIVIVGISLVVPLLFLARHGEVGLPRWPAYARALGALAFGFGLSAFFLVPFFAHTGDTLDLGWLNEPFTVVVARLFEAKTFQNFAPALHWLGLLGIALALRTRMGRFFAAAALLCVLLASDVLIRTLHLERVLPTLVKLEVNRLLLLAKLFWFPLIGFALVELVRFAWRVLLRIGLDVRLARVALVLLCMGPLLSEPGRAFLREQTEKRVRGPRRLPDWSDLQDVSNWLRSLHREGERDYRVAYDLWRGNHLPTLLPVFDQKPLYKGGTTPTQIFKNLPRAPGDSELYRAMSVKYVIATTQSSNPDLRLVKRFGSLFVHEFAPYRPEPFTLLGPGRARLVEFSDERIRIEVSGTSAETRLKLHVASYDRWRATLAGTELPITTVAVYGFRYPMVMEVPAGNGELRFEYVRRAPDLVGLWLTLLAIPTLLAVVWLGRGRRPLVERLAKRFERILPALGFLAIALSATAFAAVAVRTRSRRAILPADSLFHRLDGADLRFAGQSCEKPEPLVFRCGGERVEAEAVAGGIWGVHLCMHAPRRGVLELQKRVPLGSFLWGSYDSATRESTGFIRVAVDGQELASFATEEAYLQQQFVQFDTRARRGQTANLSILLDGSAVDCFDFRVLP